MSLETDCYVCPRACTGANENTVSFAPAPSRAIHPAGFYSLRAVFSTENSSSYHSLSNRESSLSSSSSSSSSSGNGALAASHGPSRLIQQQQSHVCHHKSYTFQAIPYRFSVVVVRLSFSFSCLASHLPSFHTFVFSRRQRERERERETKPK